MPTHFTTLYVMNRDGLINNIERIMTKYIM